MLLVVGGGVMMVDRASSSVAEGGQSAAGKGADITQGNARDPQAASVRRRGGGRQANEQEYHQGQSHQERGWSLPSTRSLPRTLCLLQFRPWRPCWLSLSRGQVDAVVCVREREEKERAR